MSDKPAEKWWTTAEVQTLKTENERLRAALWPFADMLKRWEEDADTPPIGDSKHIEMNVSVADLRAAQQALEQNARGNDG